MSTANDRKLELERKKAKLAQIREEKKRKEDEKRRNLLNTSAESSSLPGDEAKTLLTEETEKILTELGISPHAPPTPSDETAPAANESAGTEEGVTSVHASRMTVYKNRGKVSLDRMCLTPINVTPKEQVLYSKTTQTIGEPGSAEYPLHSYEWDDEFSGAAAGGVVGGASSLETNPSPSDEVFGDLASAHHHHMAGILPHIELVKPAEVKGEKLINEKPLVPIPLSDEEKQKVMTIPEFKSFFDRSSRIIERALTEKVDIFVDYIREGEKLDKEMSSSGQKMSMNRQYFDEKWTKGRCVMCLDFSVQHPELIAVSYNNNEELQNEPDGVVLVWNNKFKKTTPEFIFHCQSRVVSVSWAKFHPNLLLGGTYSGQICLWDNRQNKRTPVQKSPLSTSAHTHPVYCLKVVGTQNAHNLVSVSSDGKLCSWSLDMLSQPVECLDLQLKQSKQVAAMCLDFASNDANNFFIGSEDGSAYAGCRHGQRAGVVDSFEAHYAPVAGIHCHKVAGPVDFNHLFLTCSFDWSVKLWNARESKPLVSFEDSSDYVMDVSWSPVHPALFAVADARGKICLWHLNRGTELPATSTILTDGAGANKLMWMPSGTQLAVGDDLGRVTIYDVNEQLAIPQSSEWSRMTKVLNDIKQSQMETDELN